jgi:hypothetical protein
MCCQDGNVAIWQILYETAGWSAEAEGSFSMREQLASEELPSAEAELKIRLVPVRDWVVVKGTVPPARPPAEAEGSFSMREQLASEELPSAEAELKIRLVPVRIWVVVRDAVPPVQPGASV